MLCLRAECVAGMLIEPTSVCAVRLAQQLNCGIVFEFNGIDLHVYPTNTSEAVVQTYHRLLEIKEGKEGKDDGKGTE